MSEAPMSQARVRPSQVTIVVILILAAVITPPDVISQVIVTIPIYILFEVSILVAKRVERNENKA